MVVSVKWEVDGEGGQGRVSVGVKWEANGGGQERVGVGVNGGQGRVGVGVKWEVNGGGGSWYNLREL